MVSGLVTSPCDQLRIFSGEASMMRMASKSVIGLESSNGFERNKVTLLGGPFGNSPRLFPGFFKSSSFPGSGVYRFEEELCTSETSWVPQSPSHLGTWETSNPDQLGAPSISRSL